MRTASVRIALRSLAVVLSLCVIFTLIPARTCLALTSSGQCGENLYWEISGSELKITGYGDMYNFGYDEKKNLDVPWADYAPHISSVVFIGNSNGIATSIGDYAFYGFNSLTSFAVPYSVTSIGRYAFAQCKNLKEITNTANVLTIGDNVFSGCERLNSIPALNSVEFIGNNAFSGCM